MKANLLQGSLSGHFSKIAIISIRSAVLQCALADPLARTRDAFGDEFNCAHQRCALPWAITFSATFVGMRELIEFTACIVGFFLLHHPLQAQERPKNP